MVGLYGRGKSSKEKYTRVKKKEKQSVKPNNTHEFSRFGRHRPNLLLYKKLHDDNYRPSGRKNNLHSRAYFPSFLTHTLHTIHHRYISVDDDNIQLSAASADMAGLFSRNTPANILRGAVLSPALRVDPYYTPVLANQSPLFKLPVDAVQRGRDHGLPTYNAVREVCA